MWGNLRGWGISAVIVLLTAGGIWYLSTLNDVSPPTWDQATQDKYLAKVELSPAPRSVVQVMTNPCDAGDDYRAAITAYEANKNTYGAKFDYKSTADFEAFDDILKGTDCSQMTLLAKDPAEYMGYQGAAIAPLRALKTVVTAMTKRAAMLVNGRKADEAKKYYQAIFSLGTKLWEERLVWDELDAGQELMATGALGLARIAEEEKDTDRYATLKAFDDARSKYVTDVVMPLLHVTHNFSSDAPGNIFLLARSSQDRMWRAEAIRQLGRIRWNVGNAETASAADQRAATRLLTKWADDPTLDPVLRTTAQLARDVSEIDLQKEVTAGQQEQ